MKRTIKHEFTFAQPPGVVWAYLTDSALLEEWLMPNDFKPVVGHQFSFRTRPRFKLRFDGTIYCEVLELVPERRLVYSWKGGTSRDRPSLDSIVTWTLMPANGGTLLSLEHSGFTGMRNFLAYLIMNKGWLKIGRRFGVWINKIQS
jgi:uncharacterized protein YndB with AHSA1/START domain